MKWRIIIKDSQGCVRSIPLDHEYDTEQEAEGEAQNLADQEYTDEDTAWGLLPDNS